MRALLVHGMGRTPLSWLWLAFWLRRAGVCTESVGYVAGLERFDAISARISDRIASIARNGGYVVIGHSLGGMLLRQALAGLPPGTRMPGRLFLLGSPTRVARLATRFQFRRWYRLLAGDSGQLLADQARMAAIPPALVPCTSIAGVAGWRSLGGPFGGEPNDGIVAKSELGAAWIDEQLDVPLVHTLLPSSRRVADMILARLRVADGDIPS